MLSRCFQTECIMYVGSPIPSFFYTFKSEFIIVKGTIRLVVSTLAMDNFIAAFCTGDAHIWSTVKLIRRTWYRGRWRCSAETSRNVKIEYCRSLTYGTISNQKPCSVFSLVFKGGGRAAAPILLWVSSFFFHWAIQIRKWLGKSFGLDYQKLCMESEGDDLGVLLP